MIYEPVLDSCGAREGHDCWIIIHATCSSQRRWMRPAERRYAFACSPAHTRTFFTFRPPIAQFLCWCSPQGAERDRRFMFSPVRGWFSRLVFRSLVLFHGPSCYSNKLFGADDTGALALSLNIRGGVAMHKTWWSRPSSGGEYELTQHHGNRFSTAICKHEDRLKGKCLPCVCICVRACVSLRLFFFISVLHWRNYNLYSYLI